MYYICQTVGVLFLEMVNNFFTQDNLRLSADKKKTPAPNKYSLKSYIGQAPGMPINGIRRPPLKRKQ